jgi:hypothetical protein
MRFFFTTSLVIAGCLLVSGCAKHYTPQISLGESDDMIPLRVELRPLKHSAEPMAPGQAYGVVADKVKPAEPGELSGPITQAILRDFRENFVFQDIDRHVNHPDAILSGTINTFYEKYQPKGWTQVPGAKSVATSLAKLLDVETYTGTTAVDLDLVLRKPDGTRIGVYHGHAAKIDEFVPDKQNRPGARLNWALSKAIKEIRDALLSDAKVQQYAEQARMLPEGRQGE